MVDPPGGVKNAGRGGAKKVVPPPQESRQPSDPHHPDLSTSAARISHKVYAVDAQDTAHRTLMYEASGDELEEIARWLGWRTADGLQQDTRGGLWFVKSYS